MAQATREVTARSGLAALASICMAVLLFAPPLSAAAESTRTVLANLSSYSGKRIQIRGIIRFVPEYFLIAPYRCAENPAWTFMVPGINLGSTAVGSRPELLRLKGGLGHLFREMALLERNKGTYSIVATVVGVLEFEQPGYGADKSLPAQLVVEAVKSVKRVPNP